MTEECRRCGIPHHSTERAASGGGMGRLIDFEDGYCGVCQDYREERERAAMEWVLWRRRRPSGGRQASVRDF